MRSEILGVVVSGGSSSRMGIDKASIRWAETTLVERATSLVSETCGDVIVAGGTVAPPGIMLVPDTT
ncbi:MAG: NTP transferase domain-containing protein, partial [Acidimicrobiia bacterium]